MIDQFSVLPNEAADGGLGGDAKDDLSAARENGRVWRGGVQGEGGGFARFTGRAENARGADTLVLGCTHYPVLRPLIAAVAGPDVTLIDTGEAVARRTASVFGMAGETGEPAALILYTTAPDTAVFARGAQVILGGAASPPLVCRLVWKNGELIYHGEAASH